MRLILNFLFFLVFVSCGSFSSSEEKVLENARKNILSINKIRNKGIQEAVGKIDSIISHEGDKDRVIYDKLILILNQADSIRNGYVVGNTISNENYLKEKYYSDLRIPVLDNPLVFAPIKDSVLAYSWAGLTKDILVNYYLNNIGYHCRFYHDRVFVEPNCKIIQKGKPYKASFFYGLMGRGNFIGENLIKNKKDWVATEVNFLPDQSQKHGAWKGYQIYKHDTTVIEIPYEIVDCP